MNDSFLNTSEQARKLVSVPFAIALSLVLLGWFGIDSASAAQCISNKSSFKLNVDWYRSELIQFDNDRSTPYLQHGAIAVQSVTLSAYQGVCVGQESPRGRLYVAVLSAEDSEWGEREVSVGTGAAEILTGAGEDILDAEALRSVDGVFAIDLPPTTHWLDVWGTLLSPRTTRGAAF